MLKARNKYATLLEHDIKWHNMVVQIMYLKSFNMDIFIGAIGAWQSSIQYATMKHADFRLSEKLEFANSNIMMLYWDAQNNSLGIVNIYEIDMNMQ
jgi:hypothetical protein